MEKMPEYSKANWPDDVRLIMIEKSSYYDNPKVYEYGYYDGYQKCFESTSKALSDANKEIERLKGLLKKEVEQTGGIWENYKKINNL